MLWYIGASVICIIAISIVAFAWLTPNRNSKTDTKKNNHIAQSHSSIFSDSNDTMTNPLYSHLPGNVNHAHYSSTHDLYYQGGTNPTY